MSLLEEQIKELLQRKPELYAVPHYPQQKIGYCQELNPKDNYNLSLAIARIIPWGRFLERAYYIKNGQLSADFIKECTLVPVYLDKLVFDCDPTTYLDLRGKEKRPYLERKPLELLTKIQKANRNYIPENLDSSPENSVSYLMLQLCSAFDSFTCSQLSQEKIKEGEHQIQEDCRSVYYHIFERRCEPFTQELNINDLFLAQRTIHDINKIIQIGTDHLKEKYERLPAITNYFNQLELTISKLMDRTAQLEVDFNSDWQNNYSTHIPICIFEKGKIPHVSLLYSLDPGTHLLFFNSLDQTNPAQAAAILFDVEDAPGKSYLLLEGVVTNAEFEKIKMVNRTAQICPKLPLPLRKPHYDLILDTVKEYAASRKREVIVNMNEVTSLEERGPHEFSRYLTQLFSQEFLSYETEKIADPRYPQKSLIVSQEGGKESIYLRKDNTKLKKILEENGITIPPELLRDGKLMLYTHSWANPRKPETWVNKTEGMVYGKKI